MWQVVSRFEKDFGLRNYRFTVQKVDFIVIDAQTLDGNRNLFIFLMDVLIIMPQYL